MLIEGGERLELLIAGGSTLSSKEHDHDLLVLGDVVGVEVGLGVKPAESLLDRPLLKRVNSTNDLDVSRDDELSYKDNWDSASMRNRVTETHDQ